MRPASTRSAAFNPIIFDMLLRFLALLLLFSVFWVHAQPGSEKLNSLTVAGSELVPLPPLVLEKDSYPDFTREMVRVQWRDNDPIYLFIILPSAVKRPPAVIYLYSFPAEIDRFQDEGFCRLLAKGGVAAAGFLSALTGHRYHDRPMRQWFISEMQEALVKSVHDVSMLVDYLGTRADIDGTRVAMFGEGSGGTIATLAASVDPRLKAIDLLDPWGDWPEWMAHSTLVPEDERADYIKAEYLQRIEFLDPVRILPQLKTLPVRYQYLTKPGVTPQKVRDRLQAALPSQAIRVDHEKGLAAYKASRGADFFDWIKEQVQKAPKTTNGGN